MKKGTKALLTVPVIIAVISFVAQNSKAAETHQHGSGQPPQAKQPLDKKGAREHTKSESKAATTKSLHPAEGASVKIMAPTNGQTLKGDRIPLQFKLVKGKKGEHVHAYIDGELVGMFKSEKGTLNGIQPGKHTLELRVVASDHETELNAADRIDFVVK